MSSAVKTVTEERKQELLLEARRSRLNWIQSSQPYKHFQPSSHDPLEFLKDAPISQHLPSVIPILRLLLKDKPSNSFKTQIQPWVDSISIKHQKQQSESLVEALDDHAFAFYYQDVTARLSLPESMDLIQGMKHFVRSFHSTESIKAAVDAVQKYMTSVYATIATHTAWRGDNTHETRMMLETFIYSKCNAHCYELIQKDMQETVESLEDRLELLQFVQPAHLDIQFMQNDEWKDVLEKPISLLQSLEHLFSPCQMLRCVLEIFRCVNAALKSRWKDMTQDGESAKMPGADDVLPALILVLLAAKPKQMECHLKFLEEFATQEQLRGEAGYAFTNLFSAVQFIKELDLNQNGESEAGRPTLNIDSDQLKQKLQEHQEIVKEKNAIKEEEEEQVSEENKDSNTNMDGNSIEDSLVNLPVSDLTKARIRGEDIQDWLTKWITDRLKEEPIPKEAISSSQTNDNSKVDSSAAAIAGLPSDFKRSYQFLSTDPDSIRMSDIPNLLDEYRLLVKTTETLIASQSAKENENRRLLMKQKKQELKDSYTAASSDLQASAQELLD
ncbi:hypothetical protein CTEN210_02942 [Chaetoceros tenuissimus]|uniref:VPS9 domain-containing protein n=1 Tax=Chaetoceros tenuissimus TaxID=426638 RepID=A0AAD3CIW5_9STRA|nr:hypothetical protein CTEN210_02942 [Chaetoceros tenuissimus]